MSPTPSDPLRVARHYASSDLGQRILEGLRAAGKDLEHLTIDDLAPVDGFHVRGRAATEELAALVDVRPEHTVLDVGCGLGGTSRYLAATFGCRVEGTDLTEDYCAVARELSERVGLGERTRFRQGDALELPFEAESFDVVWTEHVQMNIADKARFYTELARVLKPGGCLAFHDLFAGAGPGLRFPVPWAAEASISHLTSADDLAGLLDRVGLERVHWQDESAQAMAFFQKVLERVRGQGWMPLGLHLLMGDEAEAKFANVLHGLEQDSVRVVKAVLRKAGG